MSKMHLAVWSRYEGDFGMTTGYRSACGQGQNKAVNVDAVDCAQCKSTNAFSAVSRIARDLKAARQQPSDGQEKKA